MSTKDQKPKNTNDDAFDILDDANKATADFIKKKSNRQMIYQGIRYTASTIKALLTGAAYVLDAVVTAGRKAWPTTKAVLGAAAGAIKSGTATYRENWGKNWRSTDEFGNNKFKWPNTAKGWWQTLNLPIYVYAGWVAAGVAFIDLPLVSIADYKDDPIYKMQKPLEKDSAGEKEWTVTCLYLDEQKAADSECAFSIPDNTWLDITYRLSNPLSISGWFTGYSPRTHVASKMLSEDSQYCAINTVLDRPVLSAEKNLPSIYRAPICADTIDDLKTKLTTTITDKNGNVTFEAGKIIEDGERLWYRAADQSWAVTGWLASAWVSAGETLGDIADWAVELVTPDPEEEKPAETEGQDADKTTSVEFNNATKGYISNDNQNVTLTASISYENGPKIKVA